MNGTELEQKYRRFDMVSRTLLYAVAGLTAALVIAFLLVKADEMKLLLGLLLAADTGLIIVVAARITEKRNAYLQRLRDERESVRRTGLFKEVFEAYRHDGFEFHLICDRFLFAEYHNNSIDIGLSRNGHEFYIGITETGISVIADEETDHPIEAEIPLSGIKTMDRLYETVNDYVQAHS